MAIDAPAMPVDAPEVACAESSKVAEVVSTDFIKHGVLASGAATSALFSDRPPVRHQDLCVRPTSMTRECNLPRQLLSGQKGRRL